MIRASSIEIVVHVARSDAPDVDAAIDVARSELVILATRFDIDEWDYCGTDVNDDCYVVTFSRDHF